jgi:hypothetical protein
MSSCLYYITTVNYGQFNSYIDVIDPDLEVNVLKMLTKWYITRFYKHLENKINHYFFYILFLHVILYYKVHSV